MCPSDDKMNGARHSTGMSLSNVLEFYDDGSPKELMFFDDGECDSRTGMSPSASVVVGF